MKSNKTRNQVKDVDIDIEWPLLSLEDVSLSDSIASTSINSRTLGFKDLDFFHGGKSSWDAYDEAKASAYDGSM